MLPLAASSFRGLSANLLRTAGKRPAPNRRKLAWLAAFATLLGTLPAQAVTYTFTGTTDATWATATNWSPTGTPTTGDTATFSGSATTVNNRTTVDLGTTQSALAVLFDTANAAAYTIGAGAASSQTLVLDNTGSSVTMTSTVANNQTINAALTLGNTVAGAAAGTTTFTNASTTNALNFAGTITGGTGGTAGIRTLNVAATGAVNISGVVSNGGATALAVNKTGAGTLTLSGTNTYTGTTSFGAAASGTILLTNSAGMGTSQINFGAFAGNVLDLAFDSTATSSNQVAAGTGVNATIVSDRATPGAGVVHTLGTATIGGGTINITSGVNVTSGTASISIGALQLTSGTSGAITTFNPTTATLTLSTVTGSVTASSAKTLNLDGTNPGNVITGAIANGTGSPAGVTSVTKTNTSTWTLQGTSFYSGLTTVTNGTIIAASNQPLGSIAAAAASGLLLNPASGTATVNFPTATPLLGSLASSGAGTSSVVLGDATGGTATNLTVGGTNTSTTFAGVISDGTAANTAAIGSLTKSGTGTLTLSGANTYTGATAVGSAGAVSVAATGTAGAASPLGTNATINLGVTTTTGGLTYTGTGETITKTINLAGTTGGGTITQSGTGNLVVSSLTETGVGAKILTLQGSTAGTGQVTGLIADSSGGATSLTKTGTGTWTLGTPNTFTGATSITGGVLAITNASALSTSTVTLGTGGTNSAGDLQLSNNVAITSVPTVNGTGRNAPTAATPGTASIENLSGNNSLSSAIVFSSTGGTYVNILSTAGTLTLSGNLSVGTQPTGSRFFEFYGAGNTVVTGAIANGVGATAALGVQKDGTGTVTLSGTNTYTGATIINGGILAATANSALGAGNATVLATAVNLTIGAGVTNPFSNNTASLTLAGGGTAGVADVGYIDLTSGATITVSTLVLGTTTEPAGTYTSALFPDYIAGNGSIIVAAVPEPTTWVLMLGGLAGLAGWQGRKRRGARA